jgi:hypothetical protein
MRFLSRVQRNNLTAILLMIIAECVVATSVAGQQISVSNANPSELLVQLGSSQPEVRSSAYEQLRSDPSALQKATVKTALLQLLDRENSIHESAMRENIGISDKYGEGYTEYVYALGETVASFVDWSDPHQVCVVVRGFAPSDAIASHARATIPCLLQKATSNLGLVRGDAVGVLVQSLAIGKNNLAPSTIESAKQVIRGALHDPDADVRTKAVSALGEYGAEDMIPRSAEGC